MAMEFKPPFAEELEQPEEIVAAGVIMFTASGSKWGPFPDFDKGKISGAVAVAPDRGSMGGPRLSRQLS